MRVGILLTCGKRLHDRIISLRREDISHKDSLTPSLFIGVTYQAKKVSGQCICITCIGLTSVTRFLELFWRIATIIIIIMFYFFILLIIIIFHISWEINNNSKTIVFVFQVDEYFPNVVPLYQYKWILSLSVAVQEMTRNGKCILFSVSSVKQLSSVDLWNVYPYLIL
jgi:hypothetical protein